MCMQHLFHGGMQIASLDTICLDSDVHYRTINSLTLTAMILQAFQVLCGGGR